MTSNIFSSRVLSFIGWLVVALLAFATQTLAHDCFLMAKPFRLQRAGEVKIAIHITEAFPGKHVAWNPERITRFHHWHGRTLLDSVVPEPVEDSSGAAVSITQSGSHMFAVDWSQRFIEIEAKDFTSYLRSEGLDHIIRLRTERKEGSKPGRELYSRYLKTFVRVGGGEQGSNRMVVGQTLEIIPLDDPAARNVGDTLRVQLLFRGAPLARAKISATHQGAATKADTYAQSTRTDKNGVASFKLTHAGAWLVRTVHMLSSESPEADWESWWASVTLAVQ